MRIFESIILRWSCLSTPAPMVAVVLLRLTPLFDSRERKRLGWTHLMTSMLKFDFQHKRLKRFRPSKKVDFQKQKMKIASLNNFQKLLLKFKTVFHHCFRKHFSKTFHSQTVAWVLRASLSLRAWRVCQASKNNCFSHLGYLAYSSL